MVCASHLKQIGLGYQTYATDSRGQYPIGNNPNCWSFGYLVDESNPLGPSTFAELYEQRLIPDGRMFYCPAAKSPAQSPQSKSETVIAADNMDALAAK